MDATNFPYVTEYYNKWNAGDINGAKAVIANHPELENCIVSAKRLQYIWDSVMSIERMWNNDIENYLVNFSHYKGAFDLSKKYSKYDVVEYTVAGDAEAFMCYDNAAPSGTLPTNATYFIPITMRGSQGASGLGLAPRGNWNNTVLYSKNDFVVYNECAWYASQDNSGKVPSENSQYWSKIIMTPRNIIHADTEPVGQLSGDFWIQGTSLKEKISDGTYNTIYLGTTSKNVICANGTVDDFITHLVSHLKSGTVHTLSGYTPVKNIFSVKFKATSDFITGDTIKIGTKICNLKLPNLNNATSFIFKTGAVVELNFSDNSCFCAAGGGGGAVIGATAPDDKTMLWIDITSGVGIQKYWNGTVWDYVQAVWG